MSDYAKVEINLNPNLLDEAHAITDALTEKLESVLKMRCPEHDAPPRIVDGGPEGTCCAAFKKQVEEALQV